MLLTVFYTKRCFKSRFLRASLRVMDWELREIDVADPKSAAELIQLKSNGTGTELITPAITTTEAYSHEMYPILEYLNDRSPDSMLPAEPAARLFVRTYIQRFLRATVEIWPAYIATGNAVALLALYEAHKSFFIAISENVKAYRSNEDQAGSIEMLHFVFLCELVKHGPIGNKAVANWFRSHSSDPRLIPLSLED